MGQMMKNGLLIDEQGARHWFQNGQLHRTDGPAIERASGDRYWYLDGKKHRTDGPAIERASGERRWYQNGLRHRTDGPAIEYTNGERSWYLNETEYSFEKYVNKIYPGDCPKKTLFILKWSSR